MPHGGAHIVEGEVGKEKESWRHLGYLNSFLTAAAATFESEESEGKLKPTTDTRSILHKFFKRDVRSHQLPFARYRSGMDERGHLRRWLRAKLSYCTGFHFLVLVVSFLKVQFPSPRQCQGLDLH